MKLTLIWTGTFSDPLSRKLAERYLERIRPFLPVEVVSVRPEKSRSRSAPEIIARESRRLIESLPPQGRLVVLDERGKQLPSIGFAKWLEMETVHNPHGVSFVLGGDLGLSDEIRLRADKVLALSQMTLPHELARVLLLEQIYRACTLMRNISYHK